MHLRHRYTSLGILLLLAIGTGVSYRRFMQVGVVVHRAENSSGGYTLISTDISTDLIDMDGRVIHQWQRHVTPAKLLSNGNLSGLFYREAPNGTISGYAEFNWQGQEVSFVEVPSIHHDFHRTYKDHVYLLDQTPIRNERIVRNTPVANERILELDKQRKLIWEWRLNDHIDEFSRLGEMDFPLAENEPPDWIKQTDISEKGEAYIDWSHLNAIQVIPNNLSGEKSKIFKAGNLLLSSANTNRIFIVDRMTEKIVWAWGRGILSRQHMPRVLPNGHILVFDNGRSRKSSRVIELEPISKTIIAEYRARDDNFFTRNGGSSEILPNGNIFVSLADYGRLLEFTKSGEVVWEFRHPSLGKLSFLQRLALTLEKMYPAKIPGISEYRKQFKMYRAERYSKEWIESILSYHLARRSLDTEE